MARQYTIGDIMNISADRQGKAGQCQVNFIRTFHELKPENILDKFKALFLGRGVVRGYYVIFKFSVMSDTGHAHTVFIRVDPDFNLQDWSNNKVQIYCDCSDFKYRSAFVLNQRNSLFLTDKIKIALGAAMTDAPKGKTSPSLLCKHGFAALSWLVQNYASVMRTI